VAAFLIGPLLDVKQLSAVNFVIEKSARAMPMVVHIDQLKPCRGETPKSWLTEVAAGSEEPRVDDGSGDGEVKEPTPAAEEVASEQENLVEGRRRRNRRPPQCLGDSAW
jgi:hypothetical protein